MKEWLCFVLNAVKRLNRFTRNPQIAISISFSRTGYEMFTIKERGFKPSWIILHHSSTPDGVTRNWDAIRKFHMEERHWNDIGYNLGIENVNGKITLLEGRKIGEVGAHALGFNANSVGICLVGNYDIDPPSEDRLLCLSSVCRDIQREFGVRRDQVIGHRETFVKLGTAVQKSCPGAMFDLDAFRKRLLD